MSNELVTLAYRAHIGNGTGKAVLAALADQANADGVCWPSITYIVERTEWDRKTVERWIAKLEEMGHLTVMRSKGNNSVYRIHPLVPPDPTRDSQSQVRPAPAPREPQGEKSQPSSAAPESAGSRAEQPVANAQLEHSSDGPIPPAATRVAQSHVDNSTPAVDKPVSSATHLGPTVPGDGSHSPRGMGPTVPGDGSHSPTHLESSLNPHGNPQLTSERAAEPDGLKKPGPRAGAGARTRSATRDELLKPPQGRADEALTPQEAERRKQQQLAAIRGRGIAV